MPILAIAFLMSLNPKAVTAQSQPEAVRCLERFIKKMSEIKGYSTRMSKQELYDGEWLVEPIGLQSEGPQNIRYKFLKRGSSGVKNNGMELIYAGGDALAIKWGEARGFGVLTNRAARAVTGNKIGLTDETTLKGELFTLNRAGFYHMATCLKRHLQNIGAAKTGGLSAEGSCKLRYAPPELKYANVHLSRNQRVEDIEEQYGTYAYHILQANKEQFKDLEALFHRDKDHDIRVPEFLLPFEMDLNAETDLPERFAIYNDGKKMGEYIFTETKTW